MSTTRIRSTRLLVPRDAAHVVPLSLGFVPESSVAVVALNRAREICLVARFDIEALADPAQWAPGLLHAIDQAAPRGDVVLVAYDDDQADAAAVLDTVAETLEPAGARILDRVLAVGSACRSLGAEGTRDESESPWRELPPLPGARRSDLVAEIAAGGDAERSLLAALLGTMEVPTESVRDAAITHALDTLRQHEATPEALALLIAGLRDLRVRDTVLWDLMKSRPRVWAKAADVLVRVVQLAPATQVAPAASLLAILRWQLGDGTRAVIAVLKALDAEPDYTLAVLVDGLLGCGLPPYAWREGLADLGRDACRGTGIAS